MKIAINHLTRMKPGFICIAGVDISTGRHVRPVLDYAQIPRAMFKNPFWTGAIVDFDRIVPRPVLPEVEDHLFDAKKATFAAQCGDVDFWNLLLHMSQPTLGALFGPGLKPAGQNGAAVDPGTGSASLGCLRPRTRPQLFEAWGKPRLSVNDGVMSVELAVTDLRLFEADQQALRSQEVTRIAAAIADPNEDVVISVGLGRAWRAGNDTEKRHWLQVNNIHIRSRACWQG